MLYRFFRISTAQLAYYRANFFLVVSYWLVSLFVLVVFWKVLFSFLPKSIGEWSFSQLCILNSLCYISWGFFVFFWGLHQIPQKVIGGTLDKFLARPISPLVGLLGEEIHLEGIYEIIAGISGICLFSWNYGFRPSFGQVFFSFLALIFGTLILVFLHGVISLGSFWFGRVDNLRNIIDTMDEFQKYPLTFYPKSFHFFLMFLVPLYFPGSFAARIYLGMPIPSLHWVFFLLSFLFWAGLFVIVYSQCLKRYEANG